MPIPNGGLITETNRQYYAGAQQFTSDGNANQTFTSTFNTNLVVVVVIILIQQLMVII